MHYLFGGNPGNNNNSSPEMRLDDFWLLKVCSVQYSFSVGVVAELLERQALFLTKVVTWLSMGKTVCINPRLKANSAYHPSGVSKWVLGVSLREGRMLWSPAMQWPPWAVTLDFGPVKTVGSKGIMYELLTARIHYACTNILLRLITS